VLTPILLVAIVFGLVLNADLMGFARGETRQVGGNSIPGLVCQAMGMNIYEPFPKAVKWTMRMLAPRMPDLAEPELEEKAENVVTLALTAWTALAVFAGLAVARKRKLPVYETFAVVFLFFFVLSFKSICLYRAWIVCPLLVIAIKRRWYWLFGAWATVSSAVLTSYGVGASLHLHLAWNGANVVFELIWLILILTAAPIETPEKLRLAKNAAGASQ